MKAWVRLVVLFGLLMGMVATAGPVAADGYYYDAAFTFVTPPQYDTETLIVSITYDGSQGIPGVQVCSTWHFRVAGDRDVCGVTNDAGVARLSYYISGATIGYDVPVDYSVLWDDGWEYCDTLAFTPV